MKVGHIDCKKDTYDVLKNTIAKNMNASLKKLSLSGALSIKPTIDDARNNSFYVALYDAENVIEDASKATIRLFLTGDLAFYAAVLGKVNMSGTWCTWCNLRNVEWERKDHDIGNEWTKEKMKQLRRDVETGTLKKTPANIKGCVDEPLIDCIELNLYVFPVLHIMIGLGNKVVNDFFHWTDQRVEMIPEEEMRARKAWLQSIHAMEKEKEVLNEWLRHNSSDLAELIRDRKLARVLKESRVEGTTGPYEYTLEERQEMKTAIENWTVTINELQKEREGLSAIVTLKKKIVAQLLKIVNEKKSKRKLHQSPIRNQLEAILLLYNVQRASYHGGDFTGGNLRNLFDNAEEVFDKFETKLKESNRPNRCSDEEIKKRCSKTKEICILMDYLFTLARTPSGDADESVIKTTRICVKAVLLKWRDLHLSFLGPKIHAVEDHLIYLMMLWNGIGCFLEDFVEQSHQTGKLEEKRTGHMGDRQQAAISHSRHEWARTLIPKIKLEKERVFARTCRKRRISAENSRVAVKQAKRQQTRVDTLARLSWEPDPVTETLTVIESDNDNSE